MNTSTTSNRSSAVPADHHGHWLQVDPSRRYNLFLARVIGAVAAASVLATLTAAVMSHQRFVEQAQADEIAFGAVVAGLPLDDIERVLAENGREGMYIDAFGSAELFLLKDSPQSSTFSRWRDRVRRLAVASSSPFFETQAPDAGDWWHVTMPAGESDIVVVSRSARDALAVSNATVKAILLAGVFALLALAIASRLLSVRVSRPLRAIVTAGEDLTVRGEMRDSNSAAVSRIARSPNQSAMRFHPPSEFRALARIVEQLENETMRGQTQAESLLAAAEALGTSLDQETVLTRTIEQLQVLLGTSRAVILTYDSIDSRRAKVVASLGHDDSYADDYHAGADDDSLASRRAIREGRPIQLSDTESGAVSADLRDRARRHGFRSMLAVPLGSNLDGPSALVLYMGKPHTFSFDEVQLAQSFAAIAGAALRNAELFARTDENLRRQTYRLDAIVESVEQGLLVEGTDGEVLFANRKMQDLFPRLSETGDLTLDDIAATLESKGGASEQAAELLRNLPSGSASRIDVSLDANHYRVRQFKVVDNRGGRIGRGQVWTDVTEDRELEQMKQGLLATVSHEFRTPLAIIKGYATTLLAEDVQWNPGDQREFLNLVSVEADRLTALVQRLLDMRRIDAGMVELQRIPTDVDVIVQSTLDAMPHHRDRITLTSPIPPVTVSVDAARIVTVLRNLLENACAYSPADRNVELSLVVEDDRLHASVRDYGPGVPADQRERIFGTFVRTDSSLDAEFGGIGLGLAIARGFVRAHDGTISVQDPDSGPGSNFTFSLPLDQAATRPNATSAPTAAPSA